MKIAEYFVTHEAVPDLPLKRKVSWFGSLSVLIAMILLMAATVHASLSCNACHTMPPTDSAGSRDETTGAFKGNHAGHAGVAVNSCTPCHGNGAASYTSAHSTVTVAANKAPIIQIASKIHNYSTIIGRAKYSRGVYFNQSSVPPNPLGTCSNVNCHFETTTPSWGTTNFVSPADCNKCHGAAPADGSHPAVSGFGKKHGDYYTTTTASCVKCHSDHTSEAKPFAHATSAGNRGLAVLFAAAPNNGFGRYTGNVGYPKYLPSQGSARNGTCQSTYCHSPGTKPAASAAVPNKSAQWGSTLPANCEGCHGGTNPASAARITNGKHDYHINNAASIIGRNLGCQECHYATTTDGTTVATLANHVNGKLNIQFNPALSPDTDNPFYNNNSSAKASSGGAKKTPGNSTSNNTCTNVYCHSDGQTNAASPTFRTVTWSDAAWTAGKQCTYCHGTQGSKAHNTGAGSSHARHVESDTAYGYSCGMCHAKTTNDINVYPALPVAVITNGSHLGRSETVRFSTGIAPGTANFTNMTGSYLLPITNKTCSSNVYCHSSGQDIAGSRPPNRVAVWGTGRMYCQDCHGSDASHTKVMSTGLHRNHLDPALNVSLGTGNQMMCAQCHAKTVGFANNTTVINRANHVNRFIDYSGQYARGSAQYNSVSKSCSSLYCHSNAKAGTTVAEFKNPPAWNSVSTLQCNGCHGNNTVLVDAANPTNPSLGQPNYQNGGAGTATANSHAKHVSAMNIVNTTGCYNCHSKTVDKNTAGKFRPYSSTHVSGGVNIVFRGISSSWKATYNPAVGSKTCTTVACHSNGRGAYQSGLQWGATSNCGYCHPIASLSATHAKHIDITQTPSFYSYTANRSAGDDVTGKYNFGCSACHPLTPGQHTTGTILIDFRPAVAGVGTLRAKNSALITAGSVVAGTANSGTTGTSGTSVKCFNIYCHSNGYATTTVYATTPDWYGGAFAGDRCANCHGNSPNSTITGSPAHYNTNFIGTGTTSGHVVGIHYNDISNGATGEATAGTGTANSHGNSLYSSTMNCDTCHYATVTSAANDKNMICTTCHNGTQATLRGNAAIANKAFHVSGSVNVAFNPIAFKSKAQIRQGSFSKYSGAFTRPAGYKAAGSYDQAKLVFNTVTMWSSGSKTCSNISCHNGQTVVWTATGGGTSCSSCHTSL